MREIGRGVFEVDLQTLPVFGGLAELPSGFRDDAEALR